MFSWVRNKYSQKIKQINDRRFCLYKLAKKTQCYLSRCESETCNISAFHKLAKKHNANKMMKKQCAWQLTVDLLQSKLCKFWPNSHVPVVWSKITNYLTFVIWIEPPFEHWNIFFMNVILKRRMKSWPMAARLISLTVNIATSLIQMWNLPIKIYQLKCSKGRFIIHGDDQDG